MARTWVCGRLGRLVDVLVLAASTAAVAPATWWISKPILGRSGGSDRMFVPPGCLEVAEHAVGAAAIMLVAMGVRLFEASVRAGVLRREWLQVFAPLGAAFAYLGATYRVATAPVSGANIGGALMVVGIGPVAIVCVLVAGIGLLEVWRATAPDHGRRPAA
ncbi:MAG: hypothetical protein AAF480_13070 [Actinomycetota bacterium]